MDAPDNFLHLLRLLEAERAWAAGDFRAAVRRGAKTAQPEVVHHPAALGRGEFNCDIEDAKVRQAPR